MGTDFSDRRRVAFLFLGLMCAVWMAYQINPTSQPQSRIRPPLPKGPSTRQTVSLEPPELQKLQKVLEWPDSPRDVPLSSSTSPNKSHYKLLYVQSNYKVGDKLLVRLEARDHNGQLKEYGGDFIRAKVHTPELKASVSGTVQDHNNGTYTLTFPLLWAGKVQVSVRLIHSSEAVQVLRHIRRSHPSMVNFLGFFIDPAQQKKEETTECNVHPPTGPVCEYVDSGTGERWFCSKPQHHPCSALVYHSAGRYKTVIPSSKSAFLDRSVTDQIIPGSVPIIEVLPSPQVTVVSPPQPCQPGLNSTNPPGFYYKDVWVSLECSSKAFPTPDEALSCLRGKIIYMIGDSTLRQWWEFLVGFIPSLKKMDLHVNYQAGPLLAVEPTQGTLLRWRAHGLPLRATKTKIADLHYLANELDAIGGGPDTVVAFTLWAHFITFPLELYVRRLQRVRQSVIRLLARSPHTLIVIKTANTGYKSVYGSDWFSMQLDSILRAMFAGINVAFVNAWAMTSCHYLPDMIHPGKVIVQNEINSFLSFICPGN